ncbi:MAG: hypothetical protein U9O56_03145 [Campylobacterota bacterium]|nr:hypothetical protein [Campylobacterota bacterium]
MKKVYSFIAGTAVLFSVNLCANEMPASDFSLFKRVISPSMNWGENGLMLVPKAQPIGKGNINIGTTTVDSGQIQGEKLYLTTGTLMIGTSEDVELGISKRTFIWENGDRTPVEMDSFHLKARVFNITDYYTPQISVGVNGSSIKSNDFENSEDILYNPYVAVTLPIKMFTENFLISITGVAEKIYNDSESTQNIYSAGADMILYDTVYLMAEAQGIGKEDEDAVINIGAKLKYGWFSIGAGLFNISQDKVQSGDIDAAENKEQYWMANINMEIPLLNLFGSDDKKPPLSEDSEEEEETEEQQPYNGKVYTIPTEE